MTICYIGKWEGLILSLRQSLTGKVIQSGVHDSTEDAITALRLYYKQLELDSQGILDEEIERLYEEGQSRGWQVPQ